MLWLRPLLLLKLSPMMVLKLHSLEQTKELARKLLAVARPGDVITLKGDLGAGKSEFCPGFC